MTICGGDPTSPGVAVTTRCGDITAVYHRGVAPFPGGFDELVALDREEVETVPAVVRYAPCDHACDDGDLCTDDAGVEAGCVHAPNQAPMCGPP